MLGTCNTRVGLQSRDRSSGTTVDGLVVVFLMFFCMFFIGDGVAIKIGFFMGDEGMGLVALTEKNNTGVL